MTYPGNTLGLPAYCVAALTIRVVQSTPTCRINLAYPDESQIEAMDAHRALPLGGLQRTDDEFRIHAACMDPTTGSITETARLVTAAAAMAGRGCGGRLTTLTSFSSTTTCKIARLY